MLISDLPIRNMTWAGKQGFQTPIENETLTVKDFGVYGNTHTERGLTCMCSRTPLSTLCLTISTLDVEFYFSGHMTPREYCASSSLDMS